MHHRYFPNAPDTAAGARVARAVPPTMAVSAASILRSAPPLAPSSNPGNKERPGPGKKREPRVYPYVIFVDNIIPGDPPTCHGIEVLRDPVGTWLNRFEKRWGLIGKIAWASCGSSPLEDGTDPFSGFLIYGCAGHPAAESKQLLIEMAANLAAHIGGTKAQLLFAGENCVVNLKNK